MKLTAPAWAVGIALWLAAAASAQEVVTLPGQDRSVRALIQPVYSVGSVEGAEWEVFGSVEDVAFDQEGNLYVLDGQGFRVVVLDRDGGHLRTLGREGGGPGEFRMPTALTVTPRGRVVVYDMARQGYSVLNSDGSYHSGVPVDFMELGARFWGELQPHPSDGFVAAYRGFDIETGDPETSRENGSVIPVLWHPLDGSGQARELARARFSGPPATMVSRPGERRMMMGPPPALGPEFAMGVLPDGGLAYIDETEYRVKLADQEDGVRKVLARPFEPEPVTEAHRRAERERRLRLLEETGQGAPLMVTQENGVRRARRDVERGREMIERLPFAERRAVLTDLAVDAEGRIWVQRAPEEIGGRGPVDILTPEGRYLGTATELESLPDAYGPGGRVAWIEQDRMGVPRVRVARLGLSGG